MREWEARSPFRAVYFHMLRLMNLIPRNTFAHGLSLFIFIRLGRAFSHSFPSSPTHSRLPFSPGTVIKLEMSKFRSVFLFHCYSHECECFCLSCRADCSSSAKVSSCTSSSSPEGFSFHSFSPFVVLHLPFLVFFIFFSSSVSNSFDCRICCLFCPTPTKNTEL